MPTNELDHDLIGYVQGVNNPNTPWCDEYEKMISGILLAQKYNSYFPHDATPEQLFEARRDMLSEMFGKTGQDCFMEPPLQIDYGINIFIGDRFYSTFGYVETIVRGAKTLIEVATCANLP
ncbi:putative sugar O-acetyltransferase [Emericellopsis atlantica]|uniref:Sugar O-acetyltransferase n=1 Tax=Emericellopsis atlantica TaxID=2614577 RepID=A0A9P8CQ26_9HYPO|nr:putative sugar O-acetyltransferase [Emericellopsis atlantica]KAG9255494.1 putative sugar O-acetyltransferase [Emericellopsis atlantica]